MTRPYCANCQYPLSTCICSVARTIPSTTPIDILQHPSEVKAAKNTARLAAHCLPKCRIWNGENECDFSTLRSQLDKELVRERRQIILLYPGEGAEDIQSVSCDKVNMRFLVLDGTWRKAYKLYQLNPWLHDYPKLEISGRASNYTFRKAPSENCLSTIESIQCVLEIVEPSLDLQALSDSLSHLKVCFSRRR